MVNNVANRIQNSRPDRELFIASLLTAWQAKGHELGVDQYLLLENMIRQLPPETDLRDLKTLLAPLLVSDPQSQHDFYRIFDETLARITRHHADHLHRVADLQRKESRSRRRMENREPFLALNDWWHSLSGFRQNIVLWIVLPLFLGAAGYAGFQYFQGGSRHPQVEENQILFIPVEITADDPAQACFTVAREWGDPNKIRIVNRSSGLVKVERQITSDGLICLNYRAETTGRETVDFEVCNSSGKCFTFKAVFRAEHYDKTAPEIYAGGEDMKILPSAKDLPATGADTAHFEPIPVEGITALDTTAGPFAGSGLKNSPGRYVSRISSAWRVETGHAYFSPAKGALVGIVLISLLLVGWWFKMKRKKLILEHFPGTQPPYGWTIRIPYIRTVTMNDGFQVAVNEMRRRDESNHRRLDVPRTVRAIAGKGGMVDFQYAPMLRNKEFLFLLDDTFPDNLRIGLFDLLISNFRENEIQIDRFFFDREGRKFWNDRFPQGMPLRDLAHKYANRYLIVVSPGYPWMAGSGTQGSRTDVFEAWRQRALLSTVSPVNWGKREAELAGKFSILPATPAGLAQLMETLESVEPADYRQWIEASPEQMHPVVIGENDRAADALAQLKVNFILTENGESDDRLLQWIAACAVSPVLFWDWTLYIGQLLSHPDDPFLTADHLFNMTRLNWFEEGKIPEKFRGALLDWLEENHPHLDMKVRHEWQKILELEENLPPVGSIAWNGHRVQVVLNELLQKPGWQRRRNLETELDSLLLAGQTRDALLVKYRENRKSRLDRLLSDRIRNVVQTRRAVSWKWRNWSWQVSLSALVFLLSLFVHYTEPVRSFYFDDYVTSVAFSPDGRSFLAASGYGGLGYCRTTGEWVNGIKDHREMIVGTGFAQDGSTILSGSADGVLKCWDASGAPLYAVKSGDDLVTSIRFSPDYTTALIGYYNGRAVLWSIAENRVLQTFTGHKDAIKDVDFSPGGDLVLTCSRDHTARVWNLKGETLAVLAGHSATVNAGCFSPDGRRVLTGSRDGKSILWAADGRQVSTLKGHDGEVFDVGFTPDGSGLFTAGSDKKARLWSESGRLLRTFEGHRDAVHTLDVSPDGSMLLTGSYDHTVRLWRLK